MSSQPDCTRSFDAVLWMLGPLAAVIVAAVVSLSLSIGVPEHATGESYSAAADVGVVL